MPVHCESWLAERGAAWHFPAFNVALGSSYFQRLLVALPHLAAAVSQVPSFAAYLPYLPATTDQVSREEGQAAV